MPHKYNAVRRHRIPRTGYKVANWPAYESGLRQRGSVAIWFTQEAIKAWRRHRGPRRAASSALAIEIILTLRAVFHQPLGQAEGLVGAL